MQTVKSMTNLAGRVAVVTGGCGHLGQTFANALAECGADIVIVDLSEKKSRSVAAEIAERWSVRTLGIGADLEKQPEVAAIPARVVETFGRFDILINNAAFVGTSGLSGWNEPFDKQSVETWRRALEVNLTALFELTQTAVPFLKKSKHASVINIASIYGIVGPDLRLYTDLPMNNPAAYAASKGGVVQFTRWCASVLAPDIRVNSITPGGIFRNQNPVFVERYQARTPMQRMAAEEDFIGPILLLASDLGRYITGQNIVVDGGFSVW